MKKELLRFKDFSFFLKTDRELSDKEKEELHKHLIKLYPAFKVFYDKNKYYSSIKPQITFLIRKDDNLVGAGKLLWHNIKIKERKIKLFGFGMLIEKSCQGKGIGTEMIKINKQEAKKRNADLLYGSTDNPIMEKIFDKAGFKKIESAVIYKDALTGKIKRENNRAYVFEFKKGLIKEINKSESFYIGIGPI